MSKKALYITAIVMIMTAVVMGLILLMVNIKKIPELALAYVAEKVEAERKQELLTDLNKADFQHVTIYYSDSDKELLPATKEALTKGMKINEQLLGSYHKPLDVVLFSTNEQIEVFSGLDYAIGFHAADLNMVGILPENREGILNDVGPTIWLYNNNVIHEYTHYALTQRLSELRLDDTDIPKWFSEGMAVYFGSDGHTQSTIDTEIIPLARLSTREGWNEYRTNPTYDIYYQSSYYIQSLAEEFGSTIFNEILTETKKTGDFQKGFQHATKMDLQEFENKVNAAL